jgi:hypothetical protein
MKYQKPTPKHHRGNVSYLHNSVQDLLVHILENKKNGEPGEKKSERRRKVHKEYQMAGVVQSISVVDVVDLSDPLHPVLYEVEDQGRTPRFSAKEEHFARRLGLDLVLIDLRELRKLHGRNPGFLDIKKWLEGKII